jgi:ParB-like chromosome segregation protein Spo0J
MAEKSLSSISTRAGSIYLARPEEIIQAGEMNARRYATEEIEGLVGQFLDPSIGQLQPIGVRQTKDGPTVVYGNKRLLAALEINEHHLYKAAKHLNGEPFRIACISVVPGVEDKAQADGAIFIKSIVENHFRRDTSPMDDAHNIDRLMDEFGKTREEIQALYGKSAAWMTKALSLLKLDAKDQKRVHTGELSLNAAYELAVSMADADAETTEAVATAVKEAEQEKGSGLSRDEVRQVSRAARKQADEKADSKATAEGKPAKDKKKKQGRPRSETTGRSLKQVRAFFTELSEFEDAEIDADSTTSQLGKQLLKFLDGGYTNNGMRRIIMKYGALVE